MIDLHIHVLPGIDDGPPDTEQTVLLARACIQDGVTAVAATSHVSDTYPTTPAELTKALQRAREAIAEAKVGLAVHQGAEIAIDRLATLRDEDLQSFSIAGNGYLLLECPYAAWPMQLDDQLTRLGKLGFRAILAHPERSAGVQSEAGLDRLTNLAHRGLLVQITAGSLTGRFGSTAKQTAQELLDRGTAHLLASDAHNTDRRPPRMGDAVATLDPDLAHWLTDQAPAAILAGERIPERPERKKVAKRFRLPWQRRNS